MAERSCSTAKWTRARPSSFTSPGTASGLPRRGQPHELLLSRSRNLHDAGQPAGIVGRKEQVIMDGSDIGAIGDIRIGRIIAVSASQAVALIEKSETQDRAWPVEMGALVKLHTKVSTVYGMVSGLRVPLPSMGQSDQELKVVELELAGEARREANGDPG